MMTHKNASVRLWLAEPVENATLVLFRIGFGLVVACELGKAWAERIEMLSERPVRFPYIGWEWLPLLPPEGAAVVHAALFVCCICIAAGLWFRITAVLFAIGYTYSFLIDRAYFNNHFYLICLLGGWLAVGNSHQRCSVDVLRKPDLASATVPRWQLWGTAIQMAIPYVYGGIAKLNEDWLRGEPMRAQLWAFMDSPLIGPVVLQPWAGIVCAWCGMLFDLCIVPALLWRKTRWPAVIGMLLFHLTNMQMFEIGIFPWLGMVSVILFLPPRGISKALGRLAWWRNDAALPGRTVSNKRLPCSPFITWCCIIWLGWQCVMPLRHYFIPGNVGWTREGFYFAWTMKLDLKSCFLGFHICNPATGECLAVDHERDLTNYQRYFLPREPRGIVQYAQFLRRRAISEGLQDAVVVCDSVCALNGRPYQYMVDPARDPAELRVPRFGHASWIVPLDVSAPIGNYKIAEAKEKAVMAVIHETRLTRGIFPERLRNKKIIDVTPPPMLRK